MDNENKSNAMTLNRPDVELRELIVTHLKTLGDNHEPFRSITQVWTKDGQMIAYRDPAEAKVHRLDVDEKCKARAAMFVEHLIKTGMLKRAKIAPQNFSAEYERFWNDFLNCNQSDSGSPRR